MTEETGENNPKDEDDTTNMDTSKCAKLFFYRYLTSHAQDDVHNANDVGDVDGFVLVGVGVVFALHGTCAEDVINGEDDIGNIDRAIAVGITQEEAIFFCWCDGDVVETNDCRVAIRVVNGREIDDDVGAIGVEGEIHFLPSSLVFERRTRSQGARLTNYVDADVATQT